MKTLLYRVRLLDGDDLDFRVVLLSYLAKLLMIMAIAYLVFWITSGSYSSQPFQNKEMNSGPGYIATHPPAPSFY